MDQVDEVKQKTDIVSLISEHVELKRAGRNFKGLCPFHSEKSPSFMVSPELQIFKCFGCGESGDAFSFLEKHEGMEFYEALKFLADKAGIKLKPLAGQQLGAKETIYKLNQFALRFYNFVLLEHKAGKKALSYLTEKRGLRLDTIKAFGVGFSPNDPIVLTDFLQKKGFTKNEILDSGIAYQRGSNVFDRFWGRVVFPLYDHRGNIVGFSGRLLPTDKRENAGKYINSPETLVYHKSQLLFGLNFSKKFIKQEGFVVVVEGELDLISPYQAGYRNIVAIKGTALTEQHVKLLARFTNKIIFALDSDVAGNEAAKRGIKIAQNEGLELLVANLGDYTDPDDMVRKNPDAFGRSLKNAQVIWDFLLDNVFAKSDPKTATGKTQISKGVTQILVDIEDKILQSHYIDVVAKKLNVPFEAVSAQVQKGKDQMGSRKEEEVQVDPVRNRQELLEEAYLAIAFQFDPNGLIKGEVVELFISPLYKKIVAAFLANKERPLEFNPSEFADTLPSELFSGFSALMLKDTGIEKDDLEVAQKEAELILANMLMLATKREIADVTKEISEKEGQKDDKIVPGLQKRLKELADNLSSLEEKQDPRII